MVRDGGVRLERMAQHVEPRVGGDVSRHGDHVLRVDEAQEGPQRAVGDARLGAQRLVVEDGDLMAMVELNGCESRENERG